MKRYSHVRVAAAVALLLLSISLGVKAQDPHYTYPFEVECPDTTMVGSPVTFRVKFPVDVKQPESTFNWAVDAGTIDTGQGTNSISVLTSGLGRQTVTATVMRVFAGSHFPMAQESGSCTTTVILPPEPLASDEFSTARTQCEDVFARVDSFLSELANDPMATGVVVVGADTQYPNAGSSLRLYLSNALKFRKFDSSRISVYMAPAAPNARTRFLIVPPGAGFAEFAQLRSVGTDYVLGAKKLPFLFAVEGGDGVAGCMGNIYDMDSFGKNVAEVRGRPKIVIYASSQKAYNARRKEVLREVVDSVISTKAVTWVYKNVRPNRMLERTELWIVK